MRTWSLILLGYCFIASITPVWVLLQPRDFLSSFLLFACLAGLALVVEMLSRWLAPEVVEDWLRGKNAHLADRAPAYLIRTGRVADVIGAIEAEKAGVYA